ncbi:MAG: hypothetical protein IPK26_11300 [Planctomycetes bacterium]|nr:hypothetical protein [Planctomycetota bacterium]
MLRSGAYADEVLVNLVQRRFVAHMYDVAPPGENAGDASAYDADAVAAIGVLDERSAARGGGGSEDVNGRVRADAYPTALFVTPEGKELGDGVWGILPPEQLLARIREVMAQWPEWFAPTPEETAIVAAADAHPEDPAAQLAAARLHWELAEFEATVTRATAGLPTAPAGAVAAELDYLAGRALTCLGRDAEARAALERASSVASGELAAAVTVALARLDLRARADDAALERLLPLTTCQVPGKWTGTAMYFAGLAHWRKREPEAAKALWRRHRTELPFDRLARRSAASLGLEEAEAFRNQELFERKGWW